jgi:hypothetical protein
VNRDQAKALALNGTAFRRLQKASHDLDNVLDIARAPGNFDYSSYFHGLANGLVLARSLLTGDDPVFLEAPDRWLEDVGNVDQVEEIKETQLLLSEAARIIGSNGCAKK